MELRSGAGSARKTLDAEGGSSGSALAALPPHRSSFRNPRPLDQLFASIGNLSNMFEALRILRLAAPLRPGDGRNYYCLGEVDRLRGDIPGASWLDENLVVLNPSLAHARYRPGWTYVKMGRREEAQLILVRQRAITTRKSKNFDQWMDQTQQFILKNVDQ